MKLVVTIDTEEDNWGSYSPTEYTLRNIERLPALQALFDQLGVQPTYLITYPVATNEKTIRILGDLLKQGNCEIGAHCHPWNTPPFEEHNTERNSMLYNLPPELQYKKLLSLQTAISTNFGVGALSFRAGRWGYSYEVAKNVASLGFKIDTSITPYTDWTIYHGPNFWNLPPEPFQSTFGTTKGQSTQASLIEIPATIGYLQRAAAPCNLILKIAEKRPFKLMRLPRLLSELRLVNKVWLSPELCDGNSMIQLTRRLQRRGHSIANLFFHSPTLVAGLTPFAHTTADETRLLNRIRHFLTFTTDSGIEPMKLSDAGDFLMADGLRTYDVALASPAPTSKELIKSYERVPQ